MCMQLVRYIRKMFSKRVKRPSIFSEAVSLGFMDTFKEMGYRFPDKNIDKV